MVAVLGPFEALPYYIHTYIIPVLTTLIRINCVMKDHSEKIAYIKQWLLA
jgi:hypothetical protein